jgi:hypothetical protein
LAVILLTFAANEFPFPLHSSIGKKKSTRKPGRQLTLDIRVKPKEPAAGTA